MSNDKIITRVFSFIRSLDASVEQFADAVNSVDFSNVSWAELYELGFLASVASAKLETASNVILMAGASNKTRELANEVRENP